MQMLTENRWEAVADHASSREFLWRILPSVTRLINEHTNAGGQCAGCGDRWPCDIACRAEFFLGGL
jgi:hypothetical protein